MPDHNEQPSAAVTVDALAAHSTPAPIAAPLRYAPLPPARRMPAFVLISGLVTTAIALIALHFVQAHVDADIMSFTVKLIIPIGALAVGFVAGLGYGIAAYFLNVRVHGWLIWLIILLQVWAYFAGHYIEFRAKGPLFEKATRRQVGFWRYYHISTIYMTEISEKPGTSGSQRSEPLGKTGYFYRLLGIAGFVLGGIIIPLVQRTLPYCPLCQRYMKTTTLLKMPATAKLPAIRVKGKFNLDTPEHKAVLQQALGAMKEMTDALKAGDVRRVRELMATSRRSVPGRVPVFAIVPLQYCRQCYQGTFTAQLKNNGNFQTALAGVLEKVDIDASVVQPVVDKNVAVPEIPQATTV